jgi:hypothetical protein
MVVGFDVVVTSTHNGLASESVGRMSTREAFVQSITDGEFTKL